MNKRKERDEDNEENQENEESIESTDRDNNTDKDNIDKVSEDNNTIEKDVENETAPIITNIIKPLGKAEQITFNAEAMKEYLENEGDEDKQEPPNDKDIEQPKKTTKRTYTTSITNGDEEEKEQEQEKAAIEEIEEINNKEKEEVDKDGTITNSKKRSSKKRDKKIKVKKPKVKRNIEDSYKEIEPTEVGNYTLSELIRTRIIGDTMKSTLEREKAQKENQQQILNHHRRAQATAAANKLNGDNDYNNDSENTTSVEFINGQLVMKQNVEGESNMDGAPVLYEGSDHITNNSFSKRTMPKRWSEKETKDFLIQLKRYGTDFTVLENVFPHRDRKQLKSKFKKEQKENPNLLDDILRDKIDYDIDDYRKQRDQVAKQKKDKEEQKKKVEDLLKLGEDGIDNGGDDDDDEFRNTINKGSSSGIGGISRSTNGVRSSLTNRYQEEVVMDTSTYQQQQAQQELQSTTYDPYSMDNDYYGTNDYDNY